MDLYSFQSTVAPGQGLGSGSSSQECRQNTRNRQKETRNLLGNKKLSESAAGAARTSDARADLRNQDLAGGPPGALWGPPGRLGTPPWEPDQSGPGMAIHGSVGTPRRAGMVPPMALGRGGCPEGSGGPGGTIWEAWGPPIWPLAGPSKKHFFCKKQLRNLFEAHQPQIWKHVLKRGSYVLP